MKIETTRALIAGALVTLFAIDFSVVTSEANDDEKYFEKTFAQKFNSISIENTSGRTEVETWNSSRVKVSATRLGDKGFGRPIESQIRFQITTNELRISIRGGAFDSAIHLTVFVPKQVALAVKGDSDAVTVKGVTSSLSVETDSGAISLSLPKNADTDLSLRSVEGSITSHLQMRVFGPVSEHVLDGRTGDGGVPVILRSMRGPVSLLSDEPGRIARADSRALDEPAGARAVYTTANLTGPTTDAPPPPRSTASADDPPVADVIKIDSRLVNLNVRVTDSNGKLIPDLTQADFQVFENNIEQQVVRFEPVTSPVNVVLLMDASGSTKERWKVIRKAAKKFIDTLSPNTRIAVAAFTRRFLVICDFNCDRKLMKDRIDDTKNLSSGTAFYDASWAALNLFKDLKEQRKAIVMLTDGVDNSLSDEEYEPRYPFDELLARISQEEVTIYPIYFDTEFQVVVKSRGSDTHESYETARQQLRKIADETGGTMFRADKAEDLDGVYQRVASELQALYSVSYNPSDKDYNGNWRDVGVKVKRGAAQARTKRGFYAK